MITFDMESCEMDLGKHVPSSLSLRKTRRDLAVGRIGPAIEEEIDVEQGWVVPFPPHPPCLLL